MHMGPCGRCDGQGGRREWPGYTCYRCRGTGRAPIRARRTSPQQARTLPATRTIASLCGGDPTKLDPSNTRALAYLGLSAEDLARYAALWREGVREIPNPAAEMAEEAGQ